MNLTYVVAIASARANRGEPKPFDIIRDAIAASEDAVIELSVAEVAILYRHFMTKTARTTAGVFDGAWVARAVAGKTDRREKFRYVYSDGCRLMATDGHRVHILSGVNRPAGYYTINGDPINCNEQYVAVDRVIPCREGSQEWTLTKEDMAACVVDSGLSTKGDELVYALPSGHGILKRYFDDAVNGMPEVTYYGVAGGKNGNQNSICIRDGDHTVVLMPMRAEPPAP